MKMPKILKQLLNNKKIVNKSNNYQMIFKHYSHKIQNKMIIMNNSNQKYPKILKLKNSPKIKNQKNQKKHKIKLKLLDLKQIQNNG